MLVYQRVHGPGSVNVASSSSLQPSIRRGFPHPTMDPTRGPTFVRPEREIKPAAHSSSSSPNGFWRGFRTDAFHLCHHHPFQCRKTIHQTTIFHHQPAINHEATNSPLTNHAMAMAWGTSLHPLKLQCTSIQVALLAKAASQTPSRRART